MPPAAHCTKTICSLQIYTILFDQLALIGHACTAFPKHTKKMCHSNTFCLRPVQHNTSWPNISLIFSNLFSLSIRATTFGTLSPLLTSLKPQIWTLLSSFSALSMFQVYPIYSSVSRILLNQNIAQKVRCDLYTTCVVHCMRYKIFLKYFHAIAFYAIAFDMIALLIVYPH